MRIGELRVFLDKTNLNFPEDIILTDPNIIAQKLQEVANIEEKELGDIMSKLFKSAIDSEEFVKTIPPGVSKGAIDAFKILISIRLINSFKGIEPSITRIAELSRISRNTVSPFVRLLESFDLISTEQQVRSLFVHPTELTNVYINVFSANLRNEYLVLQMMVDAAEKGQLSHENIKYLEYLETAFHWAQLNYDENTINYEIFKDLHDRVMMLVVEARKGKFEEFKENLNEFLEILDEIIDVREKAKMMQVQPVILEEDTEKSLGRAKVFRVR